MSLAAQQWCPTSVQVTVLQARGLRIKGKNGTNDAYAVIQVGKDKYQTSVVEKCVAPVWKEEASFDLPQLQQGSGGGGGSRLHVHVLHRALVGPDKLLGQAVINLLQLSEDKTRNKTEWFKLLDKTGKPDKDRGEVLVDIQFMRNNMTASMFDLSAAGKSRSRLGKLKDKVRGKKKESDSVTSVVPSFTQVLTDSEEEANGDGEAAAGKDGKHKKHKIKSLFSPKSNLQKSMSQSMSVLPGKNSTLSGSQSSGLNVESSEGKKKFKFMIHKRSGSSDSKDSSSGYEKQAPVEQSNLCINGSHIYCEEPPSRTSRISSNFSLSSSGHGSMEDVPENSPPSESQKAMGQYSPWEEEEEEEEMSEEENLKESVNESKRTIMEEERKEEEKVWRQQKKLESLAEDSERQEEEEARRAEEEEVKRVQEEKIRREEEERVRMEEERERLAEEKRRQELEKRKLEEERKKQRDEEERIKIEEEKKRLEEEERVEMEEKRRREEQKLAEEKQRLEERRAQEEKRRREEQKLAEEKQRLEEEKRAQEEKRRQEEEAKVAEEKRLQELERRKFEEERIRIEKEKKRLEEEERVKMEKRRQEEEQKLAEERRRLEEEERVRKEKEEKRKEEERRQKEEEEELLRKQKEEREKKIMQLEQERRQREEEERIKKEEEKKIQEEEERARKEKEEYERLEKEKMRQEEQRRIEEEEERVRMEEEMKRKVEKERARKEKEEMERLEEQRLLQEQERRRAEEEQKVRREEEERIRREKKEVEARKLEKSMRNAEASARKENKTKDEGRAAGQKSKVSSPAEVTSTNPFDENFSCNPVEEIPESPHSSTAKVATVQQRCQSAVSSVGSKTVSLDEKDLIGTQREKRPAPQPPGRSQAEKQTNGEQDVSARHLAQITKQSKDKDVKTVSVPPQRSVQMITPLCRSPTDSKNSQSPMQSNNANGTTNAAKHSKRPAPSVPHPAEEKQSSEQKTSSYLGGAETKQVVYSLNPFEDDEDEIELAGRDDTTLSSSAGSQRWPATQSQTGDKDAAPQPKLKSLKMAHAPPPPAKDDITSSTLMNLDTEGSHAADDQSGAAADSSALQACDLHSDASPVHVQESLLQESQSLKLQNIVEAGVKKDGAPAPSRRLQPVRPLNPLEQQGASVVQGENKNKSTGILSEAQDKTKVTDSGMKGPYSQLTREELISLVLKQENQLLARDHKISELEQYIDNLLVRVIEEKPSILMSMSAMKKAA